MNWNSPLIITSTQATFVRRPHGRTAHALIIAALVLFCVLPSYAKTSLVDLSSLKSNIDPGPGNRAAHSKSEVLNNLSREFDSLAINQTPLGKTQAPYDPCLPGLYRDWLEYSDDQESLRKASGVHGARILIDRIRYEIIIEALFRDGTAREAYRGAVALGAYKTPTPKGRFLINHLYCYPDVLFFASDSEPIMNLYRGFFAPLQICDAYGHCERYNDLGLHGFELSAHPHPEVLQAGVNGPVSGGCVRVSDPCAIKRNLVRLVGVGKIGKNDRGTYHWLKKNVEVVIFDEEPEPDGAITLAGILEEGLTSIGTGLKSVMNLFQP
jgi:L,D-transpeptidase catalytic domain